MIPLFKVAVSPHASARIAEVLASSYLGQGPRVDEFESALAQHLGNQRVVTVNSASSGLHLAVHLVAGEAAKHDEVGEVLTTPLTFPSTNWAILANRLNLRWVDVDPDTFNIDLDDLARKITPRTRAIMIVHWGGYPVDLDRLRSIVDDAETLYGTRLPVIEDCAHGWGSSYRGKALGNCGNIAVFSFQALKHLTTGDGGLIVLPNEELYRRARLLRWLGLDRDSDESFRSELDVTEYGFKFHMNDIAAALGLANLDIVGRNIERHQQNAAYYDQALADVPGLQTVVRDPDRISSCWLYTVMVKNRPEFIQRMNEANIMVSPVQRRNDHHTCVAQYRALLPGFDRIAERVIAIPVGWWLSAEDREHIVTTIKAGW